MSTLEKTIDMIKTMPESSVEKIYIYALFLNSTYAKDENPNLKGKMKDLKMMEEFIESAGKVEIDEDSVNRLRMESMI